MRVLSNISKRVLEDYFSAENLQLERKLTVLFTYCFLIWYPVASIAGPRKNGRAKGRETRVSPSRASSFLRPHFQAPATHARYPDLLSTKCNSFIWVHHWLTNAIQLFLWVSHNHMSYIHWNGKMQTSWMKPREQALYLGMSWEVKREQHAWGSRATRFARLQKWRSCSPATCVWGLRHSYFFYVWEKGTKSDTH